MPPRLGLCCLFLREPIRYRTVTARALRGLPRREQLSRLAALCLGNLESLQASIRAAARLGIGAFRVGSGLFPRATHPDIGYTVRELPRARRLAALSRSIRADARRLDIRLSFHPDPFVSISSDRPEVVAASIRELEAQALLAESIGAQVITIHAGGARGGKPAALARLRRAFRRLSPRLRRRLALENDDRVYTPSDLLPVCRALRIPLVYDAHHHRCLPDGLDPAAASRAAAATWKRLGREPYFHISSPRSGWRRGDPRPHADYIAPRDFPAAWRRGRFTVDVEAKAKELAVLRLQASLRRGSRRRRAPRKGALPL